MHRYDFESANYHLENPVEKEIWSKRVKQTVAKSWVIKTQSLIPLYHGLRYLNYKDFWPGKVHPLLKIKKSSREMTRIPVKLKMLTGTYLLQHMRSKIYAKETGDLCMACEEESETLEHLILECEAYEHIKTPILEKIKHIIFYACSVTWDDLTPQVHIQLIMDITKIHKELKIPKQALECIEFETRRLLYLIHGARGKILLNK